MHVPAPSVDQAVRYLKPGLLLTKQAPWFPDEGKLSQSFSPSSIQRKMPQALLSTNSEWGKNCKSQISVGEKTVSPELHKHRSQEIKLDFISWAPYRCAC